ncbi:MULTISPECIES: sensor histidine kinase [Streptomyces]|uniref:sensor histidine kinase n=1 Tax=Streptomyces TaxID=1883 RepID=UPI00069B26C0|nr:HAMP domain-containing sensor histidine kinase [Streptomyces sp. SID7805]MYU51446.1 two-component sensor histidine kinase [Streptomyces sp. SID7805]
MGMHGRIALAISLVVALTVVVFGFAVHATCGVVHAQQAHARDQQNGLLTSALQKYRRDGTLAPGARLDDSALPEPLADAAWKEGTATYVSGGSAPQVWAAARVDGKVLSLSASYAPQGDPLQSALDRALVPVGAMTAALLAVAGWFTAYGLSRRLRLDAVPARRIAAGTPPGPRPVADGGRAETTEPPVHNPATPLATRAAADHELTAGMAHELRTPVTGLVAAAELLPHPRAVEMVRDRAQAMRSLVEALLEISRLDAGQEQARCEPVDLASLVRDTVSRVARESGAGEAAAASVSVAGEGRIVETDAGRVVRVLEILLHNAARHGASPIEVTLHGSSIAVRDHGPGFPRELLDHGPRRFRTGAPDRGTGHGLGLTIAVGQAEVLGARLRFHNPSDGGAAAVFELPETRACS